MCLAIPGEVVKIEDDSCFVDYGGISREASIMLFPTVAVGDFVLVHAGFVIQIIDPEEAAELVKLSQEAGFRD